MSDIMLFGVLRMPYEMAMSDEMHRRQFYHRAQEAADRLEAALAQLEAAQEALAEPEECRTCHGGDHCRFPLCRGEVEQQCIADDVIAELSGNSGGLSSVPAQTGIAS